MNKKAPEVFSDRLLYALKKLGMSQAELARKINVKRQAVQYLCTSGATKSKFAYDIAEALNINVDWLVAGKGEMIFKTTREQQLLSEQKVVPVLNWGQINAWINGMINRASINEWTTIHGALGDTAYALQLRDNSMYPRFDSGTTIIVDPSISPTPPCFVVVYIKRIHDFVFRRLTKESGQLTLYAYNDEGYRQLPLFKEDQILGCMLEAKWSAF